MQRIYQFRQEGRTILFVSHSLDSIRNLCTAAIWLDHGELKAAGNTLETIDAYLRWTNRQEYERLTREREEREREEREREAGAAQATPADESLPDEPQTLTRWGTRDIEIERVELLDARGRAGEVFQTGAPLTVRMHYHAHQPIDDPVFGLALYHASGFHINGPNTRFAGLELGTVSGRGYVDYVIPELPLLAGEYLLTTAVHDTTMTHTYDHHERLYRFVVQTQSIRERYGSFLIPARWQWKAH